MRVLDGCDITQVPALWVPRSTGNHNNNTSECETFGGEPELLAANSST